MAIHRGQVRTEFSVDHVQLTFKKILPQPCVMPHTKLSIQTGPLTRISLSYSETHLLIQKPTKSNQLEQSHHRHDVPFRNVIQATFNADSRRLLVAYVDKQKKKGMELHLIEGEVDQNLSDHASQWVEAVIKSAYDDLGIKRFRRLMVFVNPFGGTKRGVTIFKKKIEPIFNTAGCSLEVLYTTHHGQAHDIASKLPLKYDAVISVSGDGLIHELLNGFSKHENPLKALSMPIAPIPTGSGNGLSLNLLGIEHGFDVVAAALNAIKGKPMKVDLFSFTQGEKRSVSFMSQAIGLMADLDLGTENLRWMGDSRFIYGLLRGLVKFKPCPVQLSLKLVESDKDKMAQTVLSSKSSDNTIVSTSEPVELADSDAQQLPSLKHSHVDSEGWTTFEEPILYVYGGKGPYVGRDFMAFPVSLPNDGLVDVMAMARSSRTDVVASMDGAPKGDVFWHPHVHYAKAHAYRVKPLEKSGYLSVDGEPYPFEEFHVEVHEGLGAFLSPYGHYAAHFEPRKVKGKK